MNRQYIFYDGFVGKIINNGRDHIGFTINTQDEIIFSGDDKNEIAQTFQDGIDEYAEKVGVPPIYLGLTVNELIAELAMAGSNCIPLPCQLEDGTPVTGAYMKDGCIILDTNHYRIHTAKKELENL